MIISWCQSRNKHLARIIDVNGFKGSKVKEHFFHRKNIVNTNLIDTIRTLKMRMNIESIDFKTKN